MAMTSLLWVFFGMGFVGAVLFYLGFFLLKSYTWNRYPESFANLRYPKSGILLTLSVVFSHRHATDRFFSVVVWMMRICFFLVVVGFVGFMLLYLSGGGTVLLVS